MNSRNLMIIGLFCMLPIILQAQRGQYQHKTKKSQFYGNQKLQQPLFKWVTGNYSRHGLQLSFGPAYTLTRNNPDEWSTVFNDTTMTISREPYGRIGAFVDIGMVHITKRPRKYIHYYDWGIGYKHSGGRETTSATLFDDRDSILGTAFGEGAFYNGHLYGRFAAHSVYQINPNLFLDNALGVNVDYLWLGKNKAYDGFHVPNTQTFQGNIMAQLHYELGLGIKVNGGFFVIPGIHAPIVTGYEWRGFNPNIHWFSSSYYPLQFKLKLVYLFRRDPNRCPPVEINDDDRERAKEFQNR